MQCVKRILPLLLIAACSTPPADESGKVEDPSTPPPIERVRHWGTMREVMRGGSTEGRIAIEEAVGPETYGVGALAGLAGEITIFRGRVNVAEVEAEGSEKSVRIRPPAAGEEAALLLVADVPHWSQHVLPAVRDFAALEEAVRSQAEQTGIDVTRPFPFLVLCTADSLSLHVIDGNCPIARPEGPPPFRWSGREVGATLVGFFAQDSVGVLTHHGRLTHVHALVRSRNVSGHLDDVSLPAEAVLFLPEG